MKNYKDDVVAAMTVSDAMDSLRGDSVYVENIHWLLSNGFGMIAVNGDVVFSRDIAIAFPSIGKVSFKVSVICDSKEGAYAWAPFVSINPISSEMMMLCAAISKSFRAKKVPDSHGRAYSAMANAASDFNHCESERNRLACDAVEDLLLRLVSSVNENVALYEKER